MDLAAQDSAHLTWEQAIYISNFNGIVRQVFDQLGGPVHQRTNLLFKSSSRVATPSNTPTLESSDVSRTSSDSGAASAPLPHPSASSALLPLQTQTDTVTFPFLPGVVDSHRNKDWPAHSLTSTSDAHQGLLTQLRQVRSPAMYTPLDGSDDPSGVQ